jgi:DinB superfamily
MIDRIRLLELLRESSTTFQSSFSSVSAAQFAFKPEPNRWSIAETAEHVVLAETGSGRLFQGRLTRDPTPPEVLEATQGGEDRIDARLVNRGTSFPAPEFVLPTGRWKTAIEMIQAFNESRNRTIDTIERALHDYTRFAFPHPALGPLNGHQWAYFLVRHALRHVEQIDEVKQARGYPRASASAPA